jgi:membrane-bound lytic murein transglycosylase D
MKRIYPALFVLACYCLVFSPDTVVGQTVAAVPSAIMVAAIDQHTLEPSRSTSENANIPKPLMDLMQASRMKFLEGYSLIRAGDSDAARQSFDAAVDMMLRSYWDIAATPSLNKYFQDLVQQIKDAESRYLYPSAYFQAEDEVESAAAEEYENLDFAAITNNPELREALASSIMQNSYDIPITVNEMVLKSLEFWLNRGRKPFEEGLLRSGQYRPIIEEVFREESIPMDLINLAQVESFFKTHALSKAKAKGIWQFQKKTAERYGLKVTRDIDERSDPEKSTRAAARYLKDLYAMFQDWNLALAAYNWGEGKVKRLMDGTGLNDFWQLANLKQRLPEETRKHIPLIQASTILARNPEKYGFPKELDPPVQYVKVSVSKPIDLSAAAKVLNTSFDMLKKLNPSLKGTTTPANYPNFQLKVPVDSDPDSHVQLASLPKARIRTLAEFEARHKVLRGETLTRIAARHNISVEELMRINNLTTKHKIMAGEWLQVPSVSSVSVSKKVAKKSSVSSARASKLGADKTGRKKVKKNSGTAGKVGASQATIAMASSN